MLRSDALQRQRLSPRVTKRGPILTALLLATSAAILVTNVTVPTAAAGVAFLALGTGSVIFATRAHASARSLGLILSTITIMSLPIVRFEPAPADVLALLACGTLILASAIKTTTKSIALLFRLQALLFFVSLPSLFSSSTPTYSIFYLGVTSLMYFYSYIGVYCASRWERFRLLISAYVYGAIISTSIAVFSYTTQTSIMDIDNKYGRLQGYFKDPNVLGPYLIPAVLILLFCPQAIYSKSSKASVAFRSFAVVILTSGIYLSFSRAAWLNLLVALGSYGLIMARGNPRVVIALIVSLVGGAFFLALGGSNWIIDADPTGLLRLRVGLQDYDQDRFATQSEAIHQSFTRLFVGHGTGTSETLLQYATHSSYIRMLFETGLLGFILFGALLGGATLRSYLIACRSSTVHRRAAAVISSSLIGIALNSVFIDSVHWRHMWFLVGIGWAIPLWGEKSAGQEPTK